jgi:hypothetical protein
MLLLNIKFPVLLIFLCLFSDKAKEKEKHRLGEEKQAKYTSILESTAKLVFLKENIW